MRCSIELSEDAIHPQQAEVIAVGRGEVAPQTGVIVPMEVENGDLVLIRKGIGYLPGRQSNEYFMMRREGDIEASVV